MNEAMIKIKSELGIDAVILNTRKIKTGGLFKFFKKPLLEVVAAIDEPIIVEDKKKIRKQILRMIMLLDLRCPRHLNKRKLTLTEVQLYKNLWYRIHYLVCQQIGNRSSI
ncbi:hypothetical protein QE109_00565 [Fusibacter bizertensis]|uniref:Uncharacterized protein n=1 Tax=Fusibacter bizertensis TaxID=1488331 RepID=A0ABT6N855_9FIRM|nr:hypothetical protein [Fusibacter bizertensis]MDH8676612.1 hypothetical protein [Fusibacter bizertensis]